MKSKFDQCFDLLLENEGRYSNDKHDAGGETMWGITVAVARSCGYPGEMADMPITTAKSIYRKIYWQAWMNNAEMPLAFELFDCAVNCGPTTAAKLLQRTLGVKQDGIVGPKTMAAASRMSSARLWVLFAATVMDYRASLKSWEHFSRGWTARAVNNLRRGAAMV